MKFSLDARGLLLLLAIIGCALLQATRPLWGHFLP